MTKFLLSMLIAIAGCISVNAAETEIDYSFEKIGSDGWAKYAPHTYDNGVATTIFESAVKQPSGSAITDIPVTTGKLVDVVLNNKDYSISGVTFVCTQWLTKGQTMTLHYSTDGGVTYTATKVTSETFTLTASSLPEGTNAIRISFSSSKNQVGIASCKITYAATVATVAAPTFSLETNKTYISAQTVAISCTTANIDKIYYTVDGSDPLTSDTKTEYSEPINIAETTTLKAVAVKGEDASNVSTAVYTITIPVNCASIAEFNALEDKVLAKLTCSLNVVYQSWSNLYVNDGTSGMFVYGSLNCTYKNGDVIPAGTIGTKTPYNGMVEFVPFDATTFAEATPGTTINPENKAIADITLADCFKYVVISNASISDVNEKNFKISTGSDGNKAVINGYNQFSSSVALPADLTKNYNIEGIVAIRNTNATTTPNDLSHLQFLPTSIDVATGAENAVADAVKVIGGAGYIEVVGDANAVEVYTLGGALISRNQAKVNCAADLYIVKVNGKATKVIVK